jgi:rubrerythrin
MKNQNLLNHLKIAIKNEEESTVIYEKIAELSSDNSVIDFFHGLHREEMLHYEYLMNYYQRLEKNISMKEFAYEIKYFTKPSKEIFTPAFLKNLFVNQNLLIGMKNAAELEKNSIEFYKNCCKYITDEEILVFFKHMIHWEQNHLESILYMFENMDDPEFAVEL